MRSADVYEAASAGLLANGETMLLSFVTKDTVNDRNASVLISRDLLESLYDSIGTALKSAPEIHPVRTVLTRSFAINPAF